MDSDFIINKEIFLKTNREPFENHYSVHPKVAPLLGRKLGRVPPEVSSRSGKRGKKSPYGGRPKSFPSKKSRSRPISSTKLRSSSAWTTPTSSKYTKYSRTIWRLPSSKSINSAI